MDRRTLLKFAPAASLAACVPATVQASETLDPVIPVYERWLTARADWYRYADLPGNGNWDMPESLEAEARENAAFWEILDITPISFAGIAALAHVLWDLDGPPINPDHEEYREMADHPNCKLMLGILRAAIGPEKARELIG